MQSSEHNLPPALQSPDFPAAVVRALQRIYEVSQERHDPDVGDDALTFGIHVWKSGVLFLGAAIKAIGGSTEVVNQSLAMRFGDVELRHHKLGDSETDDPSSSFPNHAGPAARMPGRSEDVQLELPLPDDEEPRVYFDWVIGSYGNPEDGLRAVRLQAVGDQRAFDGTISRWESVITLFDASVGAALPLSPNTTIAPAADVEITPEPDVALHPEAPEQQAEGA